MVEAVEVVDTVGLRCPLPLFHAREAMLDLPAGARVDVMTDDPQAPADFEAWARRYGHRLLFVVAEGRSFRIRLQRGESA